MLPSTVEAIRSGGVYKGDVLSVAQVAAIMAAKNTAQIIPMCHPLLLGGVDIRFRLNEASVEILAQDDTKVAVAGDLGWGDYVITTSSAPFSNGDMVRLAD